MIAAATLTMRNKPKNRPRSSRGTTSLQSPLRIDTQTMLATSKPIQKRYRDLCQFLCIRAYPQISRAREKLQPGMNELKGIGYLADWELAHTVDGADFKLILIKGKVFDQVGQSALPSRDDSPSESRLEAVVALLIQRGVTERVARRTIVRCTLRDEAADACAARDLRALGPAATTIDRAHRRIAVVRDILLD